jgi:F-type H+-transporting ATPase subunit gamma
MSGLKEIRTRILSVTSTRKITSAMKMVSAAKFHKAQESIYRFEPYFYKTFEVLSQVLTKNKEPDTVKWFSAPESKKNVALIILTSNSSMCGGFNQNIIKKVMEEIPILLPDCPTKTNLTLFCLGKKGADFFQKRKYNLHSASSNLIVNKPTFNYTSPFASLIIEEFLNGTYDLVYVAYNMYKNPAVQIPTIAQFLPIVLPEEMQSSTENFRLVFEPSREHILKLIIPKAMKIFLHKLILENAAGEHGARMTAMHQATDNATELIKELKLQYNKARQSSITKEILEIVSGAEALKG